jgi:hypothetical protein
LLDGLKCCFLLKHLQQASKRAPLFGLCCLHTPSAVWESGLCCPHTVLVLGTRTANNKQQTTSSKLQTTHNKQPTTNNKQQTTNNRQQAADRQQAAAAAGSRQQAAGSRQGGPSSPISKGSYCLGPSSQVYRGPSVLGHRAKYQRGPRVLGHRNGSPRGIRVLGHRAESTMCPRVLGQRATSRMGSLQVSAQEVQMQLKITLAVNRSGSSMFSKKLARSPSQDLESKKPPMQAPKCYTASLFSAASRNRYSRPIGVRQPNGAKPLDKLDPLTFDLQRLRQMRPELRTFEKPCWPRHEKCLPIF